MHTLRRSYTFALLSTMSIGCLLLSGCPRDEGKGQLTGWVSDAEGNLLALVEVALSTGAATHTDSHGLFVFDDVPAGTTHTVNFALAGYAPASKQVEVLADRVVSLEQRLLTQADGQDLPDAAAGGTASDADGNALEIPAGALEGDGTKDSHSASVHVSAVDLDAQAALEVLPGTFTVQLNAAGARGQLDAEAVVNYDVTVNGHGVTLAADAVVRITLLLPEDTEYVVDDEVPLWRFETASGLWVEGPTGVVVEGDDGRLYVTAEVSYLGWWCCGVVVQGTHGIAGTVHDEDGAVLPGALVRAVGIDYNGASYARSDEEGRYRLSVKPASQVRVDLIPPGGFYAVSQTNVTTGDVGATTTLNLAVVFDSCIAGYVLTESGEPMAGESVLSSGGGRGVTGEDGYFCIGAPGGVYVAVYVPGMPPRVVLTPDTATCGDVDLELLTLSVVYPEDGDIVGRVFSNVSTVGATSIHGATALFCAGLDGDEYAAYREQAPTEDSFTVYTKYYDLDLQASLGLDVWFNAAFSSDGDATGLLADMDFAFNGVFSGNVSASEGGTVPENAEDLEFGRIGGLDAGLSGEVGDGATVLPMNSLRNYLGGRAGQFGALGYYSQQPFFAQNTFVNGDTLTYTWLGGLDLGAFSVAAVLPDPLSFPQASQPDLSEVFEPADGAIPDLVFTWDTAATPGSYITLLLETVALNTYTEIGLNPQLHYEVEFGALVCRLVDDGAGTIPGATLGQLVGVAPAEEKSLTIDTSTRVNFLLGLRTNVSENDEVPLLRGRGGNGRVLAFSTSKPVLFWDVKLNGAVSWR